MGKPVKVRRCPATVGPEHWSGRARSTASVPSLAFVERYGHRLSRITPLPHGRRCSASGSTVRWEQTLKTSAKPSGGYFRESALHRDLYRTVSCERGRGRLRQRGARSAIAAPGRGTSRDARVRGRCDPGASAGPGSGTARGAPAATLVPAPAQVPTPAPELVARARARPRLRRRSRPCSPSSSRTATEMRWFSKVPLSGS